MKLSISNIGWEPDKDAVVYKLMKQMGYSGLEIAPTRIFPTAPYEQTERAAEWARDLRENYGFVVPSMQSIWFGMQEKLFGSAEEREKLMDYTKKAIDFAAAIECKNLVFGCPRNRQLPEGVDSGIAVSFFRELGDYAVAKGTVIGMEANPPIYNTNYINDTLAALELIEQVASEGFRLNLDVGTMIQNEEAVSELRDKVKLINHIHISEPGLKPIEKRVLHRELQSLLTEENYDGYISVEMGKNGDLSVVEQCLQYVRSVFG